MLRPIYQLIALLKTSRVIVLDYIVDDGLE